MKALKKIHLFALLTAICFGCSEKELLEGEAIQGLASVVEIQPDSTEIILTDYFLHPNKIKKIQLPQGLESNYKPGDESFWIIQKKGLATQLGSILVQTDDGTYHIPFKKSEKQNVRFSLANLGYKRVEVKGEMNAWNPNAGQMQQNSAGIWEIEMALSPGRYQYKFVVDGLEKSDPANADSVDNGIGGYNSILVIGTDGPLPYLRPLYFTETEIGFEAESLGSECLILWQNQVLEQKIEGKHGKWTIPKSCKKLRTKLM